MVSAVGNSTRDADGYTVIDSVEELCRREGIAWVNYVPAGPIKHML